MRAALAAVFLTALAAAGRGQTIEITPKRVRKKCIGSGLCMPESLRTLDEVARGELAFDRTLKVNPNPKPDDDPKIV